MFFFKLKRLKRTCILLLTCTLLQNNPVLAADDKSVNIGFLPDSGSASSDVVYNYGPADILGQLLTNVGPLHILPWNQLTQKTTQKSEAEPVDILRLGREKGLQFLYQTKLVNENFKWHVELVEWQIQSGSSKSLGKFELDSEHFFESQTQIVEKILAERSINLTPLQQQALKNKLAAYRNLQAYEGFLKGLLAVIKDDSATAEQMLKQAIRLEPEQGRYLSLLGVSLYTQDNQEKYSEALDVFTKAEALSPTDPEVVIDIASYYKYLNDYEKSKQYFSKAIGLSPQNPDLYTARCEIRYYLSENEQALADCQKAADMGQKYWFNTHLMGLVAYSQQKYPRAITLLTQAIEQAPEKAPPYAWRCKTELASRMTVEEWGSQSKGLGVMFPAFQMPARDRAAVEADCQKAVELDPQWAYAYLVRGDFWQSVDEDKRALSDYAYAIELDPNMSENYLQRGLLYLMLGRLEDGLNDLAQAVKLGNREKTPYSVALVLKMAGDDENALILLRALAEQYPEDSLLQASLAESLANSGNQAEALALAARLEDTDSDSNDNAESLGKIYLNANQLDKALLFFNKALDRNPDNAMAYYYRGYVHLIREELVDAESDLTRSLRMNPQNSKAFFFRAQVYLKYENFPKVIYDLTQFINRPVAAA